MGVVQTSRGGKKVTEVVLDLWGMRERAMSLIEGLRFVAVGAVLVDLLMIQEVAGNTMWKIVRR